MERKSLGTALALAILTGGCGPGADAGSNDAAAAAAERSADANAPESGALTTDVGRRVATIVTDLGVDPSRVTMNARFIDDLGMDSLDFVEMVMAFEEEFGIGISDQAAEQMVTVGDAVRYVEQSIAHRRLPPG